MLSIANHFSRWIATVKIKLKCKQKSIKVIHKPFLELEIDSHSASTKTIRLPNSQVYRLRFAKKEKKWNEESGKSCSIRTYNVACLTIVIESGQNISTLSLVNDNRNSISNTNAIMILWQSQNDQSSPFWLRFEPHSSKHSWIAYSWREKPPFPVTLSPFWQTWH